MDCNRNDCLHYEVCEEWKTLGNENYINESDGRCDFYKRENIDKYMADKKPTCGDCKEWGTVNCSETYREPTKNDGICEFFKAESEG